MSELAENILNTYYKDGLLPSSEALEAAKISKPMPHEIYIEILKLSRLIDTYGPETVVPKETYYNELTISRSLLNDY